MRTLLLLIPMLVLAGIVAARAPAQDAAPAKPKTVPRYLWVVSPDGEHVAAAGSDDRVEIWDVSAKRPRCEIETETGGRGTLSFVGDSQLATLDKEGTIRFWDAESGALIDSIRTRKEDEFGVLECAMHLALTAEGDKAAIAHIHNVGILVADEWQGLAIDANFAEVEFAPDGRHLLVISDTDVEYHDLDARLVTDSADSTKRVRAPPLWRLTGDRSDHYFGGRKKSEFGDVSDVSAHLHIKSKRVIVLTAKWNRETRKSAFRLSAWSLKSGKRKWELELEDDFVQLMPAPQSKELVLSTRQGIRVVSPRTGRTLKEIPFGEGEPAPKVLAPDGSVGYGADAEGNLVRFAILAKELPPWDDEEPDTER